MGDLTEVLRRHRRLFAYEDWANREALASLAAAAPPPARSVRLLAHIVGASRLWLRRLRQAKTPPAVWPELDLARCRAALEDLGRLWTAYLEELTPAGLEEIVFYVNSKG